MKILITGANGYIGKSLYNNLKDKYNVTAITRANFDLTNSLDTNLFFKNKHFDVVIHCAAAGGSRLKEDDEDITDQNLSMYYNLLNNKEYYTKFIHFGSGAEIYKPSEPYGFSKHIIAQSMLNELNFYNIRIYGVFDENELDTRFIKANIKRYINKQPIEIHQNKIMDFFYMKDLMLLVEYYILNNDLPKDIDCTYSYLCDLFSIATYINKLDDYQVDITLEKTDMGERYAGLFNSIPITWVGLKQGIQEVYNKLK